MYHASQPKGILELIRSWYLLSCHILYGGTRDDEWSAIHMLYSKLKLVSSQARDEEWLDSRLELVSSQGQPPTRHCQQYTKSNEEPGTQCMYSSLNHQCGEHWFTCAYHRHL